MKILLIGASGTVGSAIKAELAQRHDVISIGRNSGDFQVDISDSDSIRTLFKQTGKFDALVCAAGSVNFVPLGDMSESDFQLGLRDKLMGQVNVALVAQEYLNDGGSITLTSGIVAEQPIRFGAAASMTNAAVEGFVRGAAIELARGVRINVVSPTVLAESLDAYGPFFYGFEPAAASRVALAYSRSVEGAQTGQIYRVW